MDLFERHTGEVFYSPVYNEIALLVRSMSYNVWNVMNQQPLTRQESIYFELDENCRITYSDLRHAKVHDWERIGEL